MYSTNENINFILTKWYRRFRPDVGSEVGEGNVKGHGVLLKTVEDIRVAKTLLSRLRSNSLALILYNVLVEKLRKAHVFFFCNKIGLRDRDEQNEFGVFN